MLTYWNKVHPLTSESGPTLLILPENVSLKLTAVVSVVLRTSCNRDGLTAYPWSVLEIHASAFPIWVCANIESNDYRCKDLQFRSALESKSCCDVFEVGRHGYRLLQEQCCEREGQSSY